MAAPDAAVAAIDEVFNEPDNRSKAEPTKVVKAQISNDLDNKGKENTDGASQTDDNSLLSGESDEELNPRELIARKYQEKTHGIKHDEPEPQPEPVATPEEDEVTPPPEPEKVAVKVNGRTLMVDKAKVDAVGGVEFYQKQVAVSEGFKDLAAQRKQFELDRKVLENEKLALKAKPQNPPPVDDSTPASQDLPIDGQRQEERAEMVRKHREALLDGDDVTADKLMMQLLAPTQASQPTIQPVNAEELENKVVNKAVSLMNEQEQNRELKSAGQIFFSENPEVLSDQKLFSAIDLETNSVRQENPDWGTKKIMDEAYARIKEWRGDKPKAPEQNKQKIAEKRLLNSPKAGTGRAEPPPAPKQQTDSEYVTQLRKARGLE